MMKTMLEFIEELKAAGFDVYTSCKEGEEVRYIHFTKNGMIGYCQNSYFFGFDFSTVHKPNSRTGTGFGVAHGGEATLSNAHRCFEAPMWNDSSSIKYSSWDDYLKQPMNKILPLRKL